MTANENSENHDGATPHERVERRLDEIDKSLFEELEEDDRLQSGVPPYQRVSDLDFIQMTGLTRPAETSEIARPSPSVEFADAEGSEPMDFFEKGVADVDADMGPVALEHAAPGDQDIAGQPKDSTGLVDLKRIIADLTDEEERTSQVAAAPETPAAEEPAEVPAEAEPEFAEEAPLEEPGAPLAEELAEVPAEAEPEFAEEAPLEGIEAPTAEELAKALTQNEVAPEAPVQGIEAPTAEELAEALTEAKVEAETEDVTAGLPPVVPDLREAEFLLREPERPLRKVPEEPALERVQPEHAFPAGPPGVLEEQEGEQVFPPLVRDEVVYHRPSTGKEPRRASVYGRRRRRLRRWSIRVAVLIVIGLVSYQAFVMTRSGWVSPEKLFREANVLAAQGKFKEASKAYVDFARRHADHEKSAEAQFQAAYVLQLIPDESYDESRENYDASLALFEQFVSANPSHDKVGRAKGLMGVLNYRLGRWEQAIDLLRDPQLRLKDPGSSLPALRTLARAYWEIGEYDAASSAYLQAATLPENYTAELDYDELAQMYKRMADLAEDYQERRRCLELAIGQWDRAIRLPGIDPASKREIKRNRDALQDELAQQFPDERPEVDSVPARQADEKGNFRPVIRDVAPQPGVPLPGEAPAAADAPTQEIEPNPQVEAEHLATQAESTREPPLTAPVPD